MYGYDYYSFKLDGERIEYENGSPRSTSSNLVTIGNKFYLHSAIDIIANNLFSDSLNSSHVDIYKSSNIKNGNLLLSIDFGDIIKIKVDKLISYSGAGWNEACQELRKENIVHVYLASQGENDIENWGISIKEEILKNSDYIKTLKYFSVDNNVKWSLYSMNIENYCYSITIIPCTERKDIDSFKSFMIGFIDLLNNHLSNNLHNSLKINSENLFPDIRLAFKKQKFNKISNKFFSNFKKILIETVRFSTISIDYYDDTIKVNLESFPKIERKYENLVYYESPILKEFKLENTEELKVFIAFLYEIGLYKCNNHAQLNTFILILHAILTNNIWEEDEDKRKEIIKSYYPVLEEDTKYLYRNGYILKSFFNLSKNLIIKHQAEIARYNLIDSFQGKVLYQNNEFIYKSDQLVEKIIVPNLKHTSELYEFHFEILLGQKGIQISKYILTDIINSICLTHKFDLVCFSKEYEAIVNIRKESKAHKELVNSFRAKYKSINNHFNETTTNSDSDDFEDRDWIRSSYNEYFGYSGEGWADTSEW